MWITPDGTPAYDKEKRSIQFIKKLSSEDFPDSEMDITEEGDFVKKQSN